jgi:hypothetical protein
METLKTAAAAAVRENRTSVEEVLRVLGQFPSAD